MRSGERVNRKKPGALSRPGFLQQSQVALSCMSCVTKVKRNSWIVTPPATTLKSSQTTMRKKAVAFVS
jgi:hypothetical protein